ncbi:MAG: hypothetical protein ACREQ5_32810 [Candidatus Dormibacteria bacterium]
MHANLRQTAGRLAGVAATLAGIAALTACGRPALHGGASTASTGQAASQATSSPAFPICPTTVATPITSMCETSAEIAAAQTPVHSPTLPDSALTRFFRLTIGPNDRSQLTLQQAETDAVGPNGHANSAVLAEIHTMVGMPTANRLVWVVDTTPTKPTYITTETGTSQVVNSMVIIDAATGKPITGYSTSRPVNPAPTPASIPTPSQGASVPTVPTGPPATPAPVTLP